MDVTFLLLISIYIITLQYRTMQDFSHHEKCHLAFWFQIWFHFIYLRENVIMFHCEKTLVCIMTPHCCISGRDILKMEFLNLGEVFASRCVVLLPFFHKSTCIFLNNYTSMLYYVLILLFYGIYTYCRRRYQHQSDHWWRKIHKKRASRYDMLAIWCKSSTCTVERK